MDTNLYALYEQAVLCRISDQRWVADTKQRVEPIIPLEIKQSIGSFDGTGYEPSEVVRVKSTCDILSELIQPDSLVTLKSCLRWIVPGEYFFLVENAEGKECLLKLEEIEPV